MSRICVVTGASSGIGRAVSIELAGRGCTLVLGGRNLERLDETAAKCRGLGVVVETAAGDVSTLGHATLLFDKAIRLWESGGEMPGLGASISHVITEIGASTPRARPRLAAVFAAGSAYFGPTLELPDDTWAETVGTNLTGLFYCCREAARSMAGRGGGRIVNVLSMAAVHPFPQSAAYVATKYGGLGLTRSLSSEFRKDHVHFTAFLPGSVDTPLWDRTGTSLDRSKMLAAEDVARAIADIVCSDDLGAFDEVHYMPPEGIL